MASSPRLPLATLVCLAVALCGSRPATAQQAEPSPPDAPTAPVEDPVAPPPDAAPAPPTETPVDEPTPVPEVAPPPPTPAPTPEVTPSPDAVQRANRSVIVGLELGLAGATGPSSEVYGPGLGLTFVLGLGVRATSVEVRLGLGYATMPKQDALQGATTRGSFDTRSIILRRILVDGSVAMSVFGGLATASIPLLSLGPDPSMPGSVETATVSGTGVAFGAALHYPLRRHFELAAEATAYLMYWELPGRPYVHPTPSPANSSTSITYERSTDDVSGIPWTVTAGLRMLID